jgi:hypothetical protein
MKSVFFYFLTSLCFILLTLLFELLTKERKSGMERRLCYGKLIKKRALNKKKMEKSSAACLAVLA